MFAALTLNRHAALMNRMANTMGVDLTQAIATGALSGEGWRDAVERCARCAEPDHCMMFLAEHDSRSLEAAPDYCANAAQMEKLRIGSFPKVDPVASDVKSGTACVDCAGGGAV